MSSSRSYKPTAVRTAGGARLRRLAQAVLASACILLPSLTSAAESTWDELRENATHDRTALTTVLDSLGAQYERICVQLGEANWALYAKQPGPDREAAKAQLVALLTDPRNKKVIDAWQSKITAADDSLLARRLLIWHNIQIGAEAEFDSRVSSIVDRLSPLVIRFKPKVEGKEVDREQINDVLATDQNRDRRRKAFEAYVPLAKNIEKQIVQLIRLRNAKAKDLGYKDYPHMVLALSGIDYDWFQDVLKKCEEGTNAVYFDWLSEAQRRYAIEELQTWDLRYLTTQMTTVPERYFPRDKAQERLITTVRGMGFNPDSLPIKIVVADIPFGGFNVAVHIPTDDRLLVNPASGQHFYETLFHEYGHGLEATETRVSYPMLKGYEWALGASTSALSEGLGEAMSEWVRDPDWLRGVAGLPADEVKRDLPLLKRAEVVRIRQLLVAVLTEMELYRNPAGDIGGFERTLRRRILGADTPQSSQSWWAASEFLLDYPMYQQNYILAAMIGDQIHRAVVEKYGPQAHTKPDVAQFMISNFYGPAESVDWQTKIMRATGKQLDVDGFVAQLEK
jgi:peptidyl-dipeptidase A